MDSITQIVLGAAVGECVAGKKIGNRAILWGGVAGTIPDLDILANFIFSEVDALAMHRGFSHSILFAILGAFIFGGLIHQIYQSRYHKYLGAIAWSIFPIVFFLLFNRSVFLGDINLVGLVVSGSFLALCFFLIYRRYIVKAPSKPNATVKTWIALFFWSIFTHPLLDCFTTYGTQLFQPFSDYRVAFNTISVADPAYTLPFFICVFSMSFLKRTSRYRKTLNLAGIGISSIYLVFTIFNKSRVNDTLKNTLESQNISYTRYMTSPTILNNILWYGCAETEDSFVFGWYSIFDDEKKFNLDTLAKKHDLLQLKDGDRTVRILRWFSNEYYTVFKRSDGNIQLNDMRYGTFGEGQVTEKDFIFSFLLEKNENGFYEMIGSSAGPPEDGEVGARFSALIDRIGGV